MCKDNTGYCAVTNSLLLFSVKLLLVNASLQPLQIMSGDAWRVKFLEYDIIPDALPEIPRSPLQVSFPGGNAVDFGNLQDPACSNVAPNFINTTTEFGFHVIVMTDLDYPSPKSDKRREYLHWMVFGISHIHLEDGDVLTEYVPPSKSGHHGGTHRYLLTFYRQEEGMEFDLVEFAISETATDNPKRTTFSTEKFIKLLNLTQPLAANFFRIKWPDKVPDS